MRRRGGVWRTVHPIRIKRFASRDIQPTKIVRPPPIRRRVSAPPSPWIQNLVIRIGCKAASKGGGLCFPRPAFQTRGARKTKSALGSAGEASSGFPEMLKPETTGSQPAHQESAGPRIPRQTVSGCLRFETPSNSGKLQSLDPFSRFEPLQSIENTKRSVKKGSLLLEHKTAANV